MSIKHSYYNTPTIEQRIKEVLELNGGDKDKAVQYCIEKHSNANAVMRWHWGDVLRALEPGSCLS